MSRFKHLFVVTYGRSGSTLLQGILNGIPGYEIRGENGGLVEHARQLVTKADTLSSRFSYIAARPSHSWYGIDLIDRPSLVRAMSRLFVDEILKPSPDATCIGFKEIRYGPRNVRDLGGLLDFMGELFEDACFVFNSRRLEDVAQSRFWANDPSALEYLRKFEARMRDEHAGRPRDSIWVDYDRLTQEPSSLAGLFEFLEEDFDIEVIKSVLSIHHNAGPGPPQRHDPSQP